MLVLLKFVGAQRYTVTEIYESPKAVRSCFETCLIFMSVKVLFKVEITDALHRPCHLID